MFSWLISVALGATCNVSTDAIARQLVEVQLAGFRLDSSPCRVPKKFPLTKSLSFDAEEAPSTPVLDFSPQDRFEVAETKAEGLAFQTRVTWKWKVPGDKPKESMFHWRRYTEKTAQSVYGCAAILQPFEEIIVKKECLKP